MESCQEAAVEQKGLFRKRRGFTLIELMIVIAIIGILAAVAIPNFVGMTDEARVARIQADLSTVGSAVEMYYAKNGTYPGSMADLVGTGGKEGYLRKEPEPPVKDLSYVINSSTGEVTCVFKGVTYSSFGTQTAQGG
ncbi:MAG: prepilin-type N-terminal cleavage/methylation domain-containing protein [Dialister sp.]|nr:prepilin-type N-terminal cleavage/methylation domain-containing protein [Dialister sp.]